VCHENDSDTRENEGKKGKAMAEVSKDGMRVTVTVVIEMTGEQVRDYASSYGLPREGGTLRARHVVEDVREYVLNAVGESPAFGETGQGDGTRAATVTLK